MATFTERQLNAIYDRTSGYCHICRRKMAFSNYGCVGARGAWEVEHSRPRARGGTNHGNNLYGACIPCNRSKGARGTRSVRRANGFASAPMSRERRNQVRQENAVVGGAFGALLGALAGPPGAIAGLLIGARAGYVKKPDRG
jgi:HNH endonuclease